MPIINSIRESRENKMNRISTIIARLERLYPNAETALQHNSALEILVSTILSAQCTDKRVNFVTIDLFKKFETAKDFANVDQSELEQYIRSTGFYHAKAKNIINCCKALIERHRGNVPETMEDLIQLPGVGRKTANVVLGNYFGKTEGIVVDTHVKRLAVRLGISTKSDPDKIESDLMQIITKKDWIAIGNLLVWHGRKICRARKPKCNECVLNDSCPSVSSS
jgi:endonuclease-3